MKSEAFSSRPCQTLSSEGDNCNLAKEKSEIYQRTLLLLNIARLTISPDHVMRILPAGLWQTHDTFGLAAIGFLPATIQCQCLWGSCTVSSWASICRSSRFFTLHLSLVLDISLGMRSVEKPLLQFVPDSSYMILKRSHDLTRYKAN